MKNWKLLFIVFVAAAMLILAFSACPAEEEDEAPAVSKNELKYVFFSANFNAGGPTTVTTANPEYVPEWDPTNPAYNPDRTADNGDTSTDAGYDPEEPATLSTSVAGTPAGDVIIVIPAAMDPVLDELYALVDGPAAAAALATYNSKTASAVDVSENFGAIKMDYVGTHPFPAQLPADTYVNRGYWTIKIPANTTTYSEWYTDGLRLEFIGSLDFPDWDTHARLDFVNKEQSKEGCAYMPMTREDAWTLSPYLVRANSSYKQLRLTFTEEGRSQNLKPPVTDRFGDGDTGGSSATDWNKED